MSSRLIELCLAATDPHRLARFWAALLGRDTTHDGLTVLPHDQVELPIRFAPLTGPRPPAPQQIHLHLTSTTPDHQQATVARVLELGGSHLDVGQRPEEGHIVLADPEGNALCVIEADNSFLAGTGFLGELACDGSREVGLFWSAALDWPLVWDQDEETAIQSPQGGAKIAWGGPPFRPKDPTTRNLMHFHVAPLPSTAQSAEVERLLSLGASRLDVAPDEAGSVPMADPDGNEFCVLTPR